MAQANLEAGRPIRRLYMSIMVVSNVKSMKMERSEHSRCNLDMEATGLVEGWDVEMVVGGTEGKGGYMLGGIPLGQSLPFWELSETE